jgi:formyltetrahydrofolate synthetase
MPVKKRWPVPSDLEIAQEAELRPIRDVAGDAGIQDEELELHGNYMAKIDYEKLLERLKDRPSGKLITVTAITPTPLGEGKTVTAFGLGQALALRGKNIINTYDLRNQGWCYRRRVLSGLAYGGDQPPFHRRYPCS